MSTYTDFHNRRKETIQVNIDPGCIQDRATNQHIKLLNEQNEYMGTFKGKLALSATEFTNVTLSGVKIVDSELCGDIKIPTAGIDLTAIGSSISYISSTISGFISSTIDNEIEARISVDNLLSAAISSQVSASAKEVSGLLSAYTNAQISVTKDELSNVLSTYTNEVCADLSNTVKNKGFLKPGDFGFSYDGHEIILSAKNEIGQPMEFKINSAKFEENRNLKEVRRIDSSSKGPYVELIFTLEDKSEKSIEVPLSCFEYLYKAGDGIGIDDKTLAISANDTIARLEFVKGNDSYLSGKIDDNADDIDDLSTSVKQTLNELSDIRIQNIKQLKFIAHANLTWKPREYDSLSNFFITCNLVGDSRKIKNGAIIDIEKIGPKESVVIYDRDEKIALGLGDFLIVHDHNEELDVHVSELVSYGTEQNVFIARTGVSRFEFEASSAALSTAVYISDDVEITSWLSNYTEYTGGSIAIIRKNIDDEHKEHCAYVFNKAPALGYPNGHWEAMNGNYDARNVYFNDNLMTAGEWSRIGNVEKEVDRVSSFDVKGKSLVEVMEMILKGNEVFPAEYPRPLLKIEAVDQVVEYGDSIKPIFKVIANGSTYRYGSNTLAAPKSGTGIHTLTCDLTCNIKGTTYEIGAPFMHQFLGDDDKEVTITADEITALTSTQELKGNVSASVNFFAALPDQYNPKTSYENVLTSDEDIAKYKVPETLSVAVYEGDSKLNVYKPIYWKATTEPTDNITSFDASDYDPSWSKALLSGEPPCAFKCKENWFELFCLMPKGVKESWTAYPITGGHLTESDTTDVTFRYKNGQEAEYSLFVIRNDAAYEPTTVIASWN